MYGWWQRCCGMYNSSLPRERSCEVGSKQCVTERRSSAPSSARAGLCHRCGSCLQHICALDSREHHTFPSLGRMCPRARNRAGEIIRRARRPVGVAAADAGSKQGSECGQVRYLWLSVHVLGLSPCGTGATRRRTCRQLHAQPWGFQCIRSLHISSVGRIDVVESACASHRGVSITKAAASRCGRRSAAFASSTTRVKSHEEPYFACSGSRGAASTACRRCVPGGGYGTVSTQLEPVGLMTAGRGGSGELLVSHHVIRAS